MPRWVVADFAQGEKQAKKAKLARTLPKWEQDICVLTRLSAYGFPWLLDKASRVYHCERLCAVRRRARKKRGFLRSGLLVCPQPRYIP